MELVFERKNAVVKGVSSLLRKMVELIPVFKGRFGAQGGAFHVVSPSEALRPSAVN